MTLSYPRQFYGGREPSVKPLDAEFHPGPGPSILNGSNSNPKHLQVKKKNMKEYGCP